MTTQERLYKVAEARISTETEENKKKGRPPKEAVARKRVRLPLNFRPGPLDIICAKGSMAYSHSGNRWFRHFIEQELPKYIDAHTRLEKSAVVSETLASIRMATPNGGFVRQIEGVYYEIGDIKAREKISQGFRDLLHHQYRSSTKAKSERRRSMDTASTVSTSMETMSTSSVLPDMIRSQSDHGVSPSPERMPVQVSFSPSKTLSPKTISPSSCGAEQPQARQGLWPMLGMDDSENADISETASIGSFASDLDDLCDFEPLPLAQNDMEIDVLGSSLTESLESIEQELDDFFEGDFTLNLQQSTL